MHSINNCMDKLSRMLSNYSVTMVIQEKLRSKSALPKVGNSTRERSTDREEGAAKFEMKPLFLNFTELREPILEYCDNV